MYYLDDGGRFYVFFIVLFADFFGLCLKGGRFGPCFYVGVSYILVGFGFTFD